MKMNIKKYIQTLCLISSLIILSGCSDWLDTEPRDKTLESKQYSTEEGIISVLNGFYMEMSSNNLYGGRLTMTDIEHMGHYYYVPVAFSDRYLVSQYLQNYDYPQVEMESGFSAIWTSSYKLILRINIFIKNVTESNVVPEAYKNILLGEAYALRAFLHFDLFRLFGPIYVEDPEKSSIPYNDKSELEVLSNLPASEFVTKVLADVTTAKTLLKNDPILETGIVKTESLGDNATTIDKFYICLRNRRMNIVSVKALEARILSYIGDNSLAAAAAENIIADISANDPVLFNWAKSTTVVAESNYVFQSEVLFGIENNDLYSRWDTYTQGAKEEDVSTVWVTNLHQNIFNTTVVGAYNGNDIRYEQWKQSDFKDQYISVKYKKPNLSATDFVYNLQALMRLSELYYITVENAIEKDDRLKATKQLNTVMSARGYKDDELLSETTLLTKEELLKILEQEYYREFFAEGQIFFFKKKRNSQTIFKSNNSGYENISKYPIPTTGSIYVVPLPKIEISN